MVTACSTGKLSILPENIKGSNSILVIPYKASPVRIDVYNPRFGGIAGLVQSSIHRRATNTDRDKMADYLNEIRGDWDPTLATAEECLTMLRGETGIDIINSSMDNTHEIPGAELLRNKSSRLFTANENYWNSGWDKVLDDFKNSTNSFQIYKKEHPSIKEDWILEVVNFNSTMTNEHIEFMLYMKLTNSSSGKILASGNCWNSSLIPSEKGYDYDIWKKGFDFIIWEKGFREVSKDACAYTLNKMGLKK
jgi:hypothetical protein